MITFIVKNKKSNMADYYSRHPVNSGPSQFLQEVREAAQLEQHVCLVVSSVKPMAITTEQLVVKTKEDE